MRKAWLGVIWCTGFCYAGTVCAEQTRVAVATNFRVTAQALADAYAGASAHTVILTSGSTGKLYTQIMHGAPFDLFLAADQVRPARLAQSGMAQASSLSTYALGRMVLLGHKPVNVDTLSNGRYRSLAIANPKLAPYGVAALQVLQHLKLGESVTTKLVRGENVGQAYAMVATGNADIGLVAQSLLRDADIAHFWRVPEHYHEPIKQDLVLLTRGTSNAAATGFMRFTLGPTGQSIIHNAGYRTCSDD